MSHPLLQVSGLACERGDRLLFADLSLSVAPGTLLRVEGPNGAGKTTLLRILSGLHDFYDGDVRWCGEPVRRVRDHFLRNLLYLGHRPGIKPRLTPMENLRSLVSGANVGDERLEWALDEVGLLPFAHTLCDRLSAGQQRRVALARLYLSDHALWILDEAFTAIDRDGVAALESLLAARARAGGAIILTTHHPLALADVTTLTLTGAEQELAP
ncbi:heme ABC exporter ATP-binding protein CcmA [Tamilnaduibacter salinus]|uniref:Heme ABC exporter ATP-binding protein CcmA n=1 Tax=Tamilnaduibacter salinus TaxID=1484056 RepID=A0A2A2I4W7_9GAMM|nr:cytochrome c biogenesis heme-transporting ATPase CcmA [Tamilnaduibacter salinus]PAV26438.1 heme ABC exporter ATP-binding protein CcmA [Tamilnaduibacter salinus]